MRFRILLMITLIKVVQMSLANNMINLINYNRQMKGLKPLKIISNLVATANDQALYMCENSTLTHNNSTGTLKSRSIRHGFKGTKVAENIAKHKSENIEEVVNAWMSSTNHKNIILGNFTYTGIGSCLDKNGNRYWAQVFGAEMDGPKGSRPHSTRDKSQGDSSDTSDDHGGSTNKPESDKGGILSIDDMCKRLSNCITHDPVISSINSKPLPTASSDYPPATSHMNPSQTVYMFMNSQVPSTILNHPETLTVTTTVDIPSYKTHTFSTTITVTTTQTTSKDIEPDISKFPIIKNLPEYEYSDGSISRYKPRDKNRRSTSSRENDITTKTVTVERSDTPASLRGDKIIMKLLTVAWDDQKPLNIEDKTVTKMVTVNMSQSSSSIPSEYENMLTTAVPYSYKSPSTSSTAPETVTKTITIAPNSRSVSSDRSQSSSTYPLATSTVTVYEQQRYDTVFLTKTLSPLTSTVKVERTITVTSKMAKTANSPNKKRKTTTSNFDNGVEAIPKKIKRMNYEDDSQTQGDDDGFIYYKANDMSEDNNQDLDSENKEDTEQPQENKMMVPYQTKYMYFTPGKTIKKRSHPSVSKFNRVPRYSRSQSVPEDDIDSEGIDYGYPSSQTPQSSLGIQDRLIGLANDSRSRNRPVYSKIKKTTSRSCGSSDNPCVRSIYIKG